MKIILNELIGKRAALAKLVSCDIPVLASFKLGKALRVINNELQEFEKVRNDLITKHGTENKKTGNFEVKAGTKSMEEFIKELEPLLKEEIELNIEQISVEKLGEKVEFTAGDMEPLIDFIIIE